MIFSNCIKNYIESFTQLRGIFKNWPVALLFSFGLLDSFTGKTTGRRGESRKEFNRILL